MKISLAALAAVLLASALPQTGFAQGQPYIQVPVPQIPGVTTQPRGDRNYDREWWEHCERLRDREHELRDRLAYAPPYGEDRARLESRLRDVRYERERCRDRR